MEGVSGKVGENLVFRRRNGKTFLYLLTVKNNPNSPKQKKQQGKFAEAVAFARTVINDPMLKKEYERKAKQMKKESAYAAAISEHMNKGES